MKLGVFILPTGKLEKDILEWKTKVETSIPGQQYACHPPHATIIYTDIPHYRSAIQALKDKGKQLTPFHIHIRDTSVFFDDIATNGHSLYFAINRDATLMKFQRTIADVVAPYVEKNRAPHYVTANPAWANSFENYGFPFVGPHWIPHFSVASLATEKSHELITTFTQISQQYYLRVDKFSAWHVDADNHELIEEIGFG